MSNNLQPNFMAGSIGLFDSGVGGLSIFKAIQSRLPNESITYIADTAFSPYGERTEQQIKERAFALTETLMNLGAKIIVVACNSATAAAIVDMRQHFSIPIIGVEPGIKPAMEASRSGRVGVLATQATIQSQKFNDLKRSFTTGDQQVTALACPGLADLIEQGEFDDQAITECISAQLIALNEARIDTLVMGCTHYGFASTAISKALPEQVVLIDTAMAVATEVEPRLQLCDALITDRTRPSFQLCSTSNDTALFAHNSRVLLGYQYSVYAINLETPHV